MSRLMMILLSMALFGSGALGQQHGASELLKEGARWAQGLALKRQVVDRVVICFDELRFLEEIAKWTPQQFWPVLLWGRDDAVRFVEAFKPAQVLLRRPAQKHVAAKELLRRGLWAVAQAFGGEVQEGAAPDALSFIKRIHALGRQPLGLVLVGASAPECLGGLALAAGRFQVPLVFASHHKATARVSFDEMEGYRQSLLGKVRQLGLPFQGHFDDLDLVCIANGLPFGYVQKDPGQHGGGYTLDDALTRNDDKTRYAWTGRLQGGPSGSVYMAMCSLFLQPRQGLFFSRYNSKAHNIFGAFDPRQAPGLLKSFFPSEVIRHPAATLLKWRERQWPRGNRFGYLFVNSSGGATGWSTSKGQGTPFDVPDSIPCIVHYSHSGSAARPFDPDTIAGRWLENGAYIYFGSYAEPYLQAFVPPDMQARRMALGLPLGMVVRQFYNPRYLVRQKVGKKPGRLVRFNWTAPWKLAFFGDPSYRLLAKQPARQEIPIKNHHVYRSLRSFRHWRPRDAAGRERRILALIGLQRLPGQERNLTDGSLWSKLIKKARTDEERARLRLAMVRNMVTLFRRTGFQRILALWSRKRFGKLPAALNTLLEEKLQNSQTARQATFEAARLLDNAAKASVASLARNRSSSQRKRATLIQWMLALASRLPHSKLEGRWFQAWRRATLATLKQAK